MTKAWDVSYVDPDGINEGQPPFNDYCSFYSKKLFDIKTSRFCKTLGENQFIWNPNIAIKIQVFTSLNFVRFQYNI